MRVELRLTWDDTLGSTRAVQGREGMLTVQAPGYTRIVTRPMAFSIMWERFRKGEYMTWEELQADLDQMFRNAMTYNRPETVFHKQASPLGLPMPLLLSICGCVLMTLYYVLQVKPDTAVHSVVQRTLQ